ncbi:LysR family transcriptional regulator [Sneathiella sp.]|jgi:DNA-binding transcriptional LysR family regulator|uniref:LysR family transcriptional regulator n=1 Tax=Sneathiella sp. TaxID=1964365 RepID=UPI0039E5A2AA
MNWDTYRYFLAVAEEGSLSKAARRLSVSQPTVGRQIAELEQRTGTVLFNRASHGYFLTDAGMQILQNVQGISSEFAAVEQRLEGLDKEFSGRIRISTTEGFGAYWLTRKLTEFQTQYPQIVFELLLDVQPLDPRRREADIAVRINDPTHDTMIGRVAGQVGFGFYLSTAYIDRFGRPETPDRLKYHKFIDWNHSGNGFILTSTLRQIVGPADVVLKTDTVAAQIQAVRSGAGILFAPHYMVSQFPDTHLLFDETLSGSADLWVLTHKELQNTPKVRAVLDFLFDAIKADQEFLAHGLP